MAGRIAAAKAFYRELKYEVWDTLDPQVRNRIHGAYAAFESGFATSLLTAITVPHIHFKTILLTGLGAGFFALRNYLKQPSRIPLTDAERAKVTDSNATGS